MPTRKLGRLTVICALICFALSLSARSAQAQSSTDERIRLLEEQLSTMQEELQSLRQGLAEARAEVDRPKTSARQAQKQTDDVKQVQQSVVENHQVDRSPIVRSGVPTVNVAISGHINRAVNVAADGDQTKAFFVDNDVSNSRVRLLGTGDMGDGTTVSTLVELGISPNNSFDVSQDNEEFGDFFDQRKVEVFVRNDTYGRASLGKGNTASEDTAEYDLSLVAGPIMYSGISDIVGGLQFTDGDALSGITAGDAFFNFDGNGRRDRVLYELPLLGPGIQIAVSVDLNSRYDLAATWGGNYGDWSGVEIGEFLTLAAIAISDPNGDGVDYRLDGSASFLHMPTGLSLTVSGGMDKADGDDPYNLYAKAGWDTKIFRFGQTGFGLDVTHGEDVCGACDEGELVGLAAVQTVDNWGIELYSQFRWFTLDTAPGTPNLEDLYVGTSGIRAKF